MVSFHVSCLNSSHRCNSSPLFFFCVVFFFFSFFLNSLAACVKNAPGADGGLLHSGAGNKICFKFKRGGTLSFKLQNEVIHSPLNCSVTHEVRQTSVLCTADRERASLSLVQRAGQTHNSHYLVTVGGGLEGVFVFVSQYLELFSARLPRDEKPSSPFFFSPFFPFSPNMEEDGPTTIHRAQQASFGSITGSGSNSSSSMGWNVKNLPGLGFECRGPNLTLPLCCSFSLRSSQNWTSSGRNVAQASPPPRVQGVAADK